MLTTFRLPRNVASVASCRSPPTSRKSGAFAPAAGSSPLVWIGFPFNVTVAMELSVCSGCW